MKSDQKKFLTALLNAPSPSGFEQKASAIFRERLKGHVDKLIPDIHGNTITLLNPKAKFTIMLAGHIDEIGLMITHIDDNGYIYTQQIGGMDPALLVGQRMQILTDKGIVLGVVGRKAIHQMTPEDRKKGVTMDNIWIDIGVADKKEALKIVAIGDPMVVDVECKVLRGDKWISRATDDKVGAYIVAEIMRELSKKKKQLKVCVAGVATVQEEVGLRGATTSCYSVNPNVAIAYDVNFTSDHPETDKKKIGDVKLGGGPIFHRGGNVNPILEKELAKTAKKLKMDSQTIGMARPLGTDANTMQLSRGGAATAVISIPNRYMHTPVEVISITDLDNIVKHSVAFILSHPATRNYCP